MLELEEALSRILAVLPQAASEDVALSDAESRILAEDVMSELDLPPFDNSSMDGYAVRAVDLAGASKESPVRLQLVGRVAAGETYSGEIVSGTCVRLFTGSPLPAGTDAVVMQEDTAIDSTNPTTVCVLDETKPWENVRFRGEDVKRGQTLAQSGEPLSVGRISLLAATGRHTVAVGKAPRVGLLATGHELKEPGQPLGPGQIYESNRAGLSILVRRAGAIPRIFPIVPDDPEATRAALQRAFADCDIVVTSGGASVGEMDFVRPALEEVGGKLEFWKVAIKPGRPFIFGRAQGKFLFGLPGNPVSALVTFLLLARPALLRWQGAKNVSLPVVQGLLTEPLSNPSQRRHFMRVKMDGQGQVSCAGLQASHVLSSLAGANGLVDVPPQSTLAVGASVAVLRWEF